MSYGLEVRNGDSRLIIDSTYSNFQAPSLQSGGSTSGPFSTPGGATIVFARPNTLNRYVSINTLYYFGDGTGTPNFNYLWLQDKLEYNYRGASNYNSYSTSSFLSNASTPTGYGLLVETTGGQKIITSDGLTSSFDIVASGFSSLGTLTFTGVSASDPSIYVMVNNLNHTYFDSPLTGAVESMIGYYFPSSGSLSFIRKLKTASDEIDLTSPAKSPYFVIKLRS